MSERDSADDGEAVYAVVLDYLPHGRAEDERPQYQKSPVGFALGERDFRLFELAVDPDAGVSIADRVVVEPANAREAVVKINQVDFEDLTSAARSELEYAVEEIVDADEERFVDVYNEAGPITLRLHQLNLLPGIGKKLRNNVLEERKRKPFESFEELEERVSGLHDPKGVLVERIMEEIRDEDLKYRIFAGQSG
jgi:putative nucleotide binding protein